MSSHPELTLYGLKISYFTGKLENYLRYKEIPHRYQSMTREYFERIVPQHTGAKQMPAASLADGRWMTDTTPMIEWLEQQWPQYSIFPEDPLQLYLCRLVEDYADEWLWRPAMHYRWSYPAGRALLGHMITEEMAPQLPVPEVLLRWAIRRRQKKHFVDGDGVTPQTRAHVEQGYLRLLDILEPVFSDRPFLLGDRVTLADIGLSGPFFRHFSNDPTPAMIMRERAPAVYEWTARLWRARGSQCQGELVSGIPSDIHPLLKEIGETHLPNLVANAEAFAQHKKHYAVELQGARYQHIPVSQYRVWCMEELQRHFRELPTQSTEAAQALLEEHGCWDSLWEVQDSHSGHNLDGNAPFANGLEVYDLKAI